VRLSDDAWQVPEKSRVDVTVQFDEKTPLWPSGAEAVTLSGHIFLKYYIPLRQTQDWMAGFNTSRTMYIWFEGFPQNEAVASLGDESRIREHHDGTVRRLCETIRTLTAGARPITCRMPVPIRGHVVNAIVEALDVLKVEQRLGKIENTGGFAFALESRCEDEP